MKQESVVNLSNILNNGKLIAQSDWVRYIDTLKSRCTAFNGTQQQLKETIIHAVEKRIQQKHFGIFFSGGVDSTTLAYLCKKFTNDFTCYTVGVKGSEDLKWSQQIAQKLGFTLKYKELTLEELEPILKKVAQLLTNQKNEFPFPQNENLIVAVGVASVVYAAVELAKKDGVNTFFSGLGSEEIFAGYQRHATVQDVHEECWRGLKQMWQRDLLRDYTIAPALKIEVMTPFLDPDVIVAAMKIKPELKINQEHKKIILREIALDFGIPYEFAYRPKKAAQYGSKFNDALDKLAHKNNFKYKLEYVQSLL